MFQFQYTLVHFVSCHTAMQEERMGHSKKWYGGEDVYDIDWI